MILLKIQFCLKVQRYREYYKTRFPKVELVESSTKKKTDYKIGQKAI